MGDLRNRIRRDLERIAPSPTAFEDAMARVRRRERVRKVGAGAAGLMLAATVAVWLWTLVEREDAPPAEPPASPSPVATSDRLFLSGDGEAWVVDPAAASVRHLEIPELSPGDPPHRVVRRDDALVAWGYQTLIIDPRTDWVPRVLVSDSLFFIPSAAPDRVWVAILDEEQQDAGLEAVREVSVDGEVTVPDVVPPEGNWPVAAVNQGIVFQEPTGPGLFVWDPGSGTVVDRLPGEFPMAWHGDLLAWCDDRCEEVHVTDFAGGDDHVVGSPPGTFGFEALQGAFSPDGSSLALAVRLGEGQDADRQLALVDVATGGIELVDDATVGTTYVFIDWSPSGDAVFLTGGQEAEDRRVVAYRIGDAAAEVVPVDVGDFYGMAVVPAAGGRPLTASDLA